MIIINERISKRDLLVLAYCLFLSFFYLLICTKSSPLYPFNDWVDSNAFFTMGKGMMNGRVLYKDLFEQKGPLLYFIHGISYLISNNTFIGVFIFEVLSFTIFLYLCHKTINLFINNKGASISLVFIAYIVLNMPSFTHGDSAEEFCLPLLAISLYYMLSYFITIYPQRMNYKIILINGIIAGCVLWIKYSLLGFWLGWMASIFFCLVISKHYYCAINSCFVFLLGILISSLPWIYYFARNNSIYDMFYVYFLVNIKSYSQNMSIISRIYTSLIQMVNFTSINIMFGIIFSFGILIIILYNKFIKNPFHKLYLILCLFLLTLGIYSGGRSYVYYYLIYSPFIVFGIISIADFIQILVIKYNKTLTKKTMCLIILISVTITMTASMLFNHNTYMLKIKQDDLVQYKFEQIISKTENATLLNYGYLDIGLYTTTGITPNVKFFMKQNIDYSKFPLNIDEQNRYIKERKIDYIVMMRSKAQSKYELAIPYLYENYVLIGRETQMFENIDFEYLLFKIKK